MAKRKHREHEPSLTDVNTNGNKTTPFGIDPMQLMGLLGGNLDIGNIGNMLSSMNTNGFNFGNLGSLAQMMGLNLDNNFLKGNNNTNMYSNPGTNNKAYSYKNTNNKNTANTKPNEMSKKSDESKNNKEIDSDLEFLMSLRNYVHPDRINFIDKIIDLYVKGEFKDN